MPSSSSEWMMPRGPEGSLASNTLTDSSIPPAPDNSHCFAVALAKVT